VLFALVAQVTKNLKKAVSARNGVRIRRTSILLKPIQGYARLCTTLARSPKKVLLQTQVDESVASQFDKLAKSNGHRRAGYLRFIVEKLVGAVPPTTPSPNPTTKGSK
jgi:hypothetical protein